MALKRSSVRFRLAPPKVSGRIRPQCGEYELRSSNEASMTSAPSARPRADIRRLLAKQFCELVVYDLDHCRAEVIYDTGELIEAPNWTPDGRWLIFNADGRLFRISPDGRIGPQRINSAPVENLNNDHVVAPGGDRIFASSNDGQLYVLPLVGGKPTQVSRPPADSPELRHYLHGISPDGRTLAYVALERSGQSSAKTRIALMSADGDQNVFLTDGGAPVDGPEFSADGEWILFNSEAIAKCPGHAQIFRMTRDGSQLEALTEDERVNWFPHPSPDGQAIVYLSYPEGTVGHPADKPVIIRLMRTDGTGRRDLDAFNGGQGTINVNSWAPDSRRFAYVRYPQR